MATLPDGAVFSCELGPTRSMDALLMARLQFAANMTFHILFPTITIGLSWVLLFFRLRWLATHDQGWLDAYRFWTKVFALSFALGVVSGVTMSFQFGTNWPGYMERIGNIAGPLLGYEVLTAFFLEDRKSTRLNSSHVESTYAVFCLKKEYELTVSLNLDRDT